MLTKGKQQQPTFVHRTDTKWQHLYHKWLKLPSQEEENNNNPEMMPD